MDSSHWLCCTPSPATMPRRHFGANRVTRYNDSLLSLLITCTAFGKVASLLAPKATDQNSSALVVTVLGGIQSPAGGAQQQWGHRTEASTLLSSSTEARASTEGSVTVGTLHT